MREGWSEGGKEREVMRGDRQGERERDKRKKIR